MRVAIYARVSSQEQHPENQLEELRRYVAARGWTATEYVDHGVGYSASMAGMLLAFVYFMGFTALLTVIGGVMVLLLAFIGLNTLCERFDGQTVVAMLLGFCVILALADVGEDVGMRIFSWSLGVLVAIGAWSSVRLLWVGKPRDGSRVARS
jgi:hypothetical protein